MKIPFTELLRRNQKHLEHEKERIEAELKTIEKSSEYQNDNTLNGEVELESKVEDLEIRESNDSIKKTLQTYLSQIRAALNRMRHKKYGICERCGKAISPERLAANPAAIYCLACAELLEQHNEEA